uniref:hypothetical protein n=1 Tax=Streptococcus pluranimalium TaxID=82348 RepID=UPI003F691767
MIKEVVGEPVMLSEEKKSNDLSIKIIKKYRFVGGDIIIDEDNTFYGIVVMKGNQEFYRPVYPYVSNLKDRHVLESFIDMYEEKLLSFYRYGHNYNLGLSLFGIDCQNIERDSWFKRGLVIY